MNKNLLIALEIMMNKNYGMSFSDGVTYISGSGYRNIPVQSDVMNALMNVLVVQESVDNADCPACIEDDIEC